MVSRVMVLAIITMHQMYSINAHYCCSSSAMVYVSLYVKHTGVPCENVERIDM